MKTKNIKELKIKAKNFIINANKSIHILLRPCTFQDEKDFLNYQINLRKTASQALQEAMDVLDIIDCKTQSLIEYIGLSFAALVFLLTGINDDIIINLLIFGDALLIHIVLFFLIILSIALIFCLSCLNIVGAHTMKRLKCEQDNERMKEYENLIIKVTLSRRKRYLLSFYISIFTALCLGIIFLLLFLGGFS